MLEGSAHFEDEQLIINKLGTFGQSWYNILNRNTMVHWISITLCTYTAAIYWPTSKLHLGWNNTLWPSSCISKMIFFFFFYKWTIHFVFVLSFTRSIVLYSTTLLSDFYKPQCFLSNCTNNMHILASGPEPCCWWFFHLQSKIKSRIGFLFRKQSLLHSCGQTYPRKTDHPTDPWLQRCPFTKWMPSIPVPSFLSPKPHILPTTATCTLS
jgi:hypothetical protein